MMAKIMLSSMRMRASLTLSRSRLREGEPTGLPLSTAAHLPLATPASLGLAHLACHRRHDAAGCEVADPSPPILAHDLAAPLLQAALMGVLCPSALSREACLIWIENSVGMILARIFRWRNGENRCRKSGLLARSTISCYDRTERSGTSKRKRESNLHQKTRREA